MLAERREAFGEEMVKEGELISSSSHLHCWEVGCGESEILEVQVPVQEWC